jgi:hypothetical protein
MIHLRDLADPSVSNNTAVIQDAMNKAATQGVPLFLDAGQWRHTGLTVPSGLTMLGAGVASELYNTSASIALDATGASDFKLRDFAMRGTATVSNTYAYPTVSQTGTGIKVSGSSRFVISNIRMTLMGTAIQYEANGNWGAKGRFIDLDIDFVYRAVWATNSGEYAVFRGIHVDKSTFGIHVDSGNNIFSECQVVRSGVAVKLNGGTNNGHGQFVNCTFNHNNYNLDIFEAVTLGETFIGCHFIGDISGGNSGQLRITNSKGITLLGCHIGSDVTITGGASSGMNLIADCYMREELPGYTAPALVSGGQCLLKNNYKSTGLVTWNN